MVVSSLAGRQYEFTQGRPWWATVPRSRWPAAVSSLLEREGQWDAVYGDRGQEIVFIGCGMDKAAVEAALEGALVTDGELSSGPEVWEGWDDPFDFFPYEDEEGEGEDGEGEGHGHDEGHVHSEACAHGAARRVIGPGGAIRLEHGSAVDAADK